VIDLTRRAETERIDVPGAPVQVAVAPNNRLVYVTLEDTNAIAAIDLSKHRVVRHLNVGKNPAQLSITPNGKLLVVANQGTAESPDNRVTIVDTATFRTIATVKAGKGPHGVAIDSDSRRAYVTNVFSGTLSVIDLDAGKLVHTYDVGKYPNGLTVY
jgi:YVTN family beta-propeller protein